MSSDTAAFCRAGLEQVLAEYGFADSGAARFSRLPTTNANHNGKLSIAGSDWVIKRYPGSRYARQLAMSHWFQHQLYSGGAAVAQLLPTRAGEACAVIGDETFSVHAWVEGTHVDYRSGRVSPAVTESLAQQLARLHQQGRDIYRLHPAPRHRQRLMRAPGHYRRQVERLRRWRISALTALQLKPFKSQQDRWVLANFARLREIANLVAAGRESIFTDVCYIHNDIYWGNLIFDQADSLLAFIDFDKMQVNSWEYEVGCGAALCAVDSENIERFVSAYEEEAGRALAPNALALAMLTKVSRSALWCVHAHLRGFSGDPGWLLGWSEYLGQCLDALESYINADNKRAVSSLW